MDINGHKKVIQAIPYYNEQTTIMKKKQQIGTLCAPILLTK